MRKDIHIFFSGPEKYNTDDLCDVIKDISPKYFILWHPWEGYESRLTEYLNWDYVSNHNHSEKIQKFENTLVDNDVICYVLLGVDYNEEKYKNYKTNPIKNFKILFWPTALLHYTYYGMTNFYDGIENSRVLFDNIQKIYINLNNHPTEHRSQLIDNLCKYDLLNDGINTWNADFNEYSYHYSHWTPTNLKFDEFDKNNLIKSFTKKLLNSNTLFNLVCETSHSNNNIFYTEKTFKPILMAQPFIILGNVNQNHNLTKYGFVTYDKVVDYSFDKNNSLDFRILGIINNIIKFKNIDLNNLYQTIRSEIELNRLRAITIVNDDPYIPNELITLYTDYGDYFIDLFKHFNEHYNSGFGITQNLNLIQEIFKNK